MADSGSQTEIGNDLLKVWSQASRSDADKDVHDYWRRLERSVALAREKLPPGEFKNVSSFLNSCLAERISPGRCSRHVFNVRRFWEILEKDYASASKKDVERVFGYLNGMGLRP